MAFPCLADAQPSEQRVNGKASSLTYSDQADCDPSDGRAEEDTVQPSIPCALVQAVLRE